MLRITHLATATAVGAATTQESQLAAFAAAWAGADVIVRAFSANDVLLDISTYAAWAIDNNSTPRRMALGALKSRTWSGGQGLDAAKLVMRVGSTDIAEISASRSAGTGPIFYTDVVRSQSRTRITSLVLTARASLPIINPPLLATLAGPSTAVIGVANAYSVTLDKVATQPVIVTPSATDGGTLTPSTPVTIPAGQSSAAFNVMWSLAGTGRLVDFTTNPSLTKAGAPKSVAVAAPAPVPTPPPPPPPAPAPAPGTELAQITLNAPVGGRHAWATGHAFKQGELPSTASLANVQCSVISRWPDGSALLAVVAGMTPVGNAVDTPVSLSLGTAPTGVALTPANLPAGLTASIGGSISGEATFTGSDWTTPFRVVATGPLMSQWVFRKAIDATLHAYIEVRIWSNGSVEMLPWLENGYVNVAGTVSRNETWTFSLGGVQRESIPADFIGRTRLVLVTGTKLAHWLGTDPAVVVLHNKNYLRATKVTPNHTAPSTAAHVSTWVDSITTPHERGRYPAGMGSAGAHESIGPLPQWDAMYLTLNDAKTWRVLQQQGYRAGRWGMHYRDENDGFRPARASLHSTRIFGNSSGIADTGVSTTGSIAALQTGTAAPVYKTSHHPSMGFMAAIVSGRWFHIETSQFAASINGLYQSDAYRRWSGGPMAYRLRSYMQPRGFGWALRTLAQAYAITPDSDPMKAEFANHLAGTISFNHARYVAQASNPLGMMTEYNPDNIIPIPNGPFIGQTFMQNFIVQSMGYARHLTADGVEGTKLAAWFAWAGLSVTGRLGINPATEYLYRDAENPYQWVISTATSPDWNTGTGPWVPNWSAVWQETAVTTYAQAPLNGQSVYHGYTVPYVPAPAKELGDGSLRGGGLANPQNYWHNFMPALAYCVDFNLPGAKVGYDRIVGAPNFNSGVATFDGQFPHWAVRPRGYEWAAALPADTWTAVGASSNFFNWATAGGIPAGSYIGTDPFASIVTAYCDAAFDLQSRQYFFGGGHGDGSCNAVVRFDWATLQYSLVGLPTPPSKYPPKFGSDRLANGGSPTQPGPLVYPSGVNGNGFFLDAPPLAAAEDLPFATPLARSSTHMYGAGVLDTNTGKIHYFYLTYAEFDTNTGTWGGRGYDIVAALVAINPSLASMNSAVPGLTTGTMAVYDPVTARFFITLNPGDNAGAARSGIFVFEPITRTIEAIYLTGPSTFGQHLGGEALTIVGRKLYVFTKFQPRFDAPATMLGGYTLHMDTRVREKFVITGGATVSDDSTFGTFDGWPMETIPSVYDGNVIWRWNYGSPAKRTKMLRLNLTPVSGAGSVANPFVLEQTNRAITGLPAGIPAYIYNRMVWLPAAGCIGLVGDARQQGFVLKLG